MSSAVDYPRWVEAAAGLPIGFAQVREDALLDLAVVGSFDRPPRVLMVASGGCTAAMLAASGKAASLHLVDPNPAQIALSRLKLAMLTELTPAERLKILGHAEMMRTARKQWLSEALGRLELAADVLGPPDFVAEAGPDYAGRYERVFLALGESLQRHRKEIESLLRLIDPASQRQRAAPETLLGQALAAALADVLALPNLVRLFGEEATRNPVMSFDQHFAERVRHALASLPAADNPYLWQMLLARYPAGISAPWLLVDPPASMPAVTWECGLMQAVLEPCSEEFDFVHLSNILDWLTPERAAETLERSWSALRRGGCVLVRQLNSSLDIRALGPRFEWEVEGGRALHARDRSFFYRALHWGFKR